MQENRGQRDRIYKRSMRYTGLGLVLVMLVEVILLCSVACGGNATTPKESTESTSLPLVSTEKQDPITSTEETDTPILGAGAPNYSIESIDWRAEAYEQGWRYYEIPSSYKMADGEFSEDLQVYLWRICRGAGVDYYMALALIERESGYRYGATGDSGNSKGLMQIQERWHKDRMRAVGATDLYNPYDNMRVGVNFLKEIQDRYLDNSGAHCVLMVYNMGATGANRLWAEGIYSTAYTRYILQRAQEIKQEIQDQ